MLLLLSVSVVAAVSTGVLLVAFLAGRAQERQRAHGLVARWSYHRSSSEGRDDDDVDLLAEAWARVNGVPMAGPLVASKLRLFRAVAERRSHPNSTSGRS